MEEAKNKDCWVNNLLASPLDPSSGTMVNRRHFLVLGGKLTGGKWRIKPYQPHISPR